MRASCCCSLYLTREGGEKERRCCGSYFFGTVNQAAWSRHWQPARKIKCKRVDVQFDRRRLAKTRPLVRSEDVEGDARTRAGQVSQGQQRQGKEVAPTPTRPTDRLPPYQDVSSASRADPLMERQTTYREGGQLWEEGGTERGEVYADAGSWASSRSSGHFSLSPSSTRSREGRPVLGLTGSYYIQDRTPALGRTVRPTLHTLTQSISSPLINSDTINDHQRRPSVAVSSL